ncbi:MAG TPA: transposase [Roseiflexaceae bacterium]
MPYDPARHHRRSLRLKGYDYTQPGAYFVTICVYQRQHLFGNIEDGVVVLSLYGQEVARCWRALPRFFPSITLDEYVVMPDHLHGIIVIQRAQRTAGASAGEGDGVWRGTTPSSLSAILQNFKSISTRRINPLRAAPGAPLWQRDFYEHIIRDSEALERVRAHIVANPASWRAKR